MAHLEGLRLAALPAGHGSVLSATVRRRLMLQPGCGTAPTPSQTMMSFSEDRHVPMHVLPFPQILSSIKHHKHHPENAG